MPTFFTLVHKRNITLSMRTVFNLCIYFFLSLSISNLSVAIESYEDIIYSHQWPKQQHVDKITDIKAIQTIFQHFEEVPEITVNINYPGGLSGLKWAKDLQQWLVALGIPSEYIHLSLGSGGPNQLRLQLVDRR